MYKYEELSNPKSCLSRAHYKEMIFVLLGRDPAAAATVRFWIGERLRLGKNICTDQQILDAEECAKEMENEK